MYILYRIVFLFSLSILLRCILKFYHSHSFFFCRRRRLRWRERRSGMLVRHFLFFCRVVSLLSFLVLAMRMMICELYSPNLWFATYFYSNLFFFLAEDFCIQLSMCVCMRMGVLLSDVCGCRTSALNDCILLCICLDRKRKIPAMVASLLSPSPLSLLLFPSLF